MNAPTFRVGLFAHTDTLNETGSISRQAQLAERLGFSEYWIPDHSVHVQPMVDALTAAAIATAVTTTLTVGTGVLQLPLRHPITVAKAAITLANESAGRFSLGVGAGGDHRPEWSAFGLDPDERAGRFAESLEAVVALTRGTAHTSDGRFVSIDAPPLTPAPIDDVPLWLGARQAQILKNVSRIDGWLALNPTPSNLAAGIVELERASHAAGLDRRPQVAVAMTASIHSAEHAIERAHASFGIPREVAAKRAIGGASQIQDRLDAFRDAGVDAVLVSTIEPPDEAWERLATATGRG